MFTCMYTNKLAILVQIGVIIWLLAKRYIVTATAISITGHTLPVFSMIALGANRMTAHITSHCTNVSSHSI